MPKREDIHRVLVIGSGPIVIGQAAEFDYAGTQACRALKEEGLEVVLINSNPATINDRRRHRRLRLHRAPGRRQRQEGRRARAAGRGPCHTRRPDGPEPCHGAQRGGLLGPHGRARHRHPAPGHQEGGGPPRLPGDDARHRRAVRGRPGRGVRRGRLRLCRAHRLPGHRAPGLHAGRLRRRHLHKPRGAGDHLRQRAAPLARAPVPDRKVHRRLEGDRVRGPARRLRQPHHRLQHGEPRPRGRAHGRLHRPSRPPRPSRTRSTRCCAPRR